MTRSEASQLVAMLVAAYAGSAARVSDETAEVYERMLLGLDAQAAQEAVVRLIRTSKWLPTIAEVLEAATALQSGVLRSGAEAWGDVVSAIRAVGHIGSPRFEDQLVADIVARWGWRQLCLSPNDAADRARFIELYDKLASRARADEVSGIPLPAPRGVPRLGGFLRALPGGGGCTGTEKGRQK